LTLTVPLVGASSPGSTASWSTYPPVGPQKASHDPGCDGEREIVHGELLAITLAHTTNIDHTITVRFTARGHNTLKTIFADRVSTSGRMPLLLTTHLSLAPWRWSVMTEHQARPAGILSGLHFGALWWSSVSRYGARYFAAIFVAVTRWGCR